MVIQVYVYSLKKEEEDNGYIFLKKSQEPKKFRPWKHSLS